MCDSTRLVEIGAICISRLSRQLRLRVEHEDQVVHHDVAGRAGRERAAADAAQ